MYAFIQAHRQEFRVKQMCQVLHVSSSGYYAWRRRAPSPRAQANAHLLAAYRHHALTAFGDAIIFDDEGRLLLADEAAAWLFPRDRECAPEYYDWWIGVFENL